MRRQYVGKRFLVAALAAATIMLVLPAKTRADGALVFNQGHGLMCAFSVGGNSYEGSGTEVVTPTGEFKLSCHMILVSGTPVARPTMTTVGNCELIETPGGRANASCPINP
jgi:hypothetical protein